MPNTWHTTQLVATIKENFKPETKLAVMGTIQFATAIHTVRAALDEYFPDCYIPQVCTGRVAHSWRALTALASFTGKAIVAG